MNLFENVLNERTRYVTVVLEDIYQSQNASAVLRTCDCFWIQDVHVIENRNNFELNTEVSLGADKWLNIHKYDANNRNTLYAIRELRKKNYRIIATSPHINNVLPEIIDLSKRKIAVFFGTEPSGLSETVMENADEYFRIPMYGFTESFNISVSVALVLQDLKKSLNSSGLDWQLSENEKDELRLRWLRLTIKMVDKIEKRYHEKN